MSILRWIMPRHRRPRAGMRRFIFIVLMVLAGAQIGAMKAHRLHQAESAPKPRSVSVPVTYKSQQECESVTGKKCDFVMCDYVPPGKTFEEVCGGVSKGWQPMQDAPSGQ